LDGFSSINFGIAGSQVAMISSNANGVFTVGNQGSVGFLGTNYGTLGAWGSSGGGLRIYRGTSAGIPIGTIYADAGGLFLSTNEAQPMMFSINSTEKARIDSSGNLLVQTTNATTNAGIGFKVLARSTDPTAAVVGSETTNSSSCWSLYSTGAGAFRFYVGYGGTIFATSTTISAISDIRFKENVRDLDVGLDKIMALKPRLYDWKEGKGVDIKNARGFIAQEFEEVFPDLIDEWKDPAPEGEEPYKSVRQDLIPVLVKAIQEQQALITTLTARITALEGA
jgi:hypothetical protein